MSGRRLVCTAAAMGVVAVALTHLTPPLATMSGALASPQRTVDDVGADALLLSVAGLAAWLVWVWGAVGLVLTAASAAPGLAGGTARVLLRVVLPAGARHGAAVALGLGLGVTSPVSVVPTAVPAPVLAAAATPLSAIPDWPAPPDTTIPDWPTEVPADAHVVVRGDCLWDVAEARLRAAGAEPTSADVASAVATWWSVNADVIGSDPDLILPGQVLHAPDHP